MNAINISYSPQRLGTLFLKLFFWATLLGIGSCDGFTDVDLPLSQLTTPAVFEDQATATAAMTDIYTRLRENGLLTGNLTGLSHQLGLYADELDLYSGAGSSSYLFYVNALQATGAATQELWNSSYSQIYAANAVYEGVGKSKGLSATDKNQLQGEALLVRALVHFYLLQVYGDIPYVTTTDYVANGAVRRQAVAVVYDLMKTDLNTAIALLPEDYVTAERVRPNRWAAMALLARLHLYTKAYDEASEAASAVLNQTGLYAMAADLDQVFLKESPATIWQLMPGMAGDNTREAATFSFVTGPPPNSALSAAMLGSFEAGDQRLTHWVRAVTDGTSTWHYAYKYKQALNTGSSLEYSVVFRLAELYLIRAEARAMQGELIGAAEDLNVVRHAAGLGDTTATSASELVAAVLQERRVELFTEFGHRFMDLKRLGLLDATLAATKAGWNPTDALFPLPQAELLLNTHLLPQNAGY